MFQIGNERVALVTDTSCDLSDEQLSQYDIRTVALRVATSQGEFRDRLGRNEHPAPVHQRQPVRNVQHGLPACGGL